MYNGYENEDEYLRSLKQNDSYNFQYNYEYVSNRYGEGDDDVDLENATLYVTLTWDDSPSPGYTVSYHVDAPTPIPNAYTGDETQIFEDLLPLLESDLFNAEIGFELYKDWP